MITDRTRVAVVDDVASYAETAAGIAEEAGLVPWIISEQDGTFRETDELLDRVRATGCSAVICDHRLSQTQFALFTGAEFMSRLYQESIPGILLSTFSAIDADTSIRLYRATIPSVINREALDPDQILQGLRHCKAELEGHIAPERQPRRTLVRVLNVSTDSDTPVVDAILHSWSANSAIRFPLTAIDDQKITDVLTVNFRGELRLFAEVNVGCRDESELFFRAFEFAPEPNIDDLAT